MRKVIILGAILIFAAAIYYIKKRREKYDGPSLAYDPSVRASIAGIGPYKPRQNENFCAACM